MFLQEKSGAFFKRKKFCCVVLILLSLNKHTFPNTCGWKTSPYAFCRVGVLNVFQCAPRCVRIIEIKRTFTAALSKKNCNETTKCVLSFSAVFILLR